MADGQIRVEISKGYTVLQNEALRDHRLSFKARGLLAYMLSLPPEWNFSISGLSKINRDGKDAIRSALNELEETGYLVREGQAHGGGGKFAGCVYVLYDVSDSPSSENPTTVEVPSSGKPSSDKPSSENPTQINKDQVSKDLSNTPLPPKGGKRDKSKTQVLDPEVRTLLRSYVGNDQVLAEALAALLEVRTAKKAVNSRRAIKTLLAELDRLSGGDRGQKLLLIRQSVANSWKSVFPLKGGGQQGGGRPPRRREEVDDW